MIVKKLKNKLMIIISCILLISCSANHNEDMHSVKKSKKVIPSESLSTPIKTPNYNQSSSWAALPSMPNASNSVPKGSKPAIKHSNVDVFYIHPTTYKSMEDWNQDINDTKTNEWTDASTIARQASVFNQCCEIYAPRYRQASLKARSDPQLEAEGGVAYRLAYSDVLKAFDYYIKNYNKGRPFIIAGHSQGALLGYWLLKDRIDNSALENQLIAAYLIGVDLMAGDFGRTYQSLELCKTPQQTACILSWNAGTKELNIDMFQSMVGGRYVNKYKTQEGRKSVCINPLTFDENIPEAPASASKGAIGGAPGFGELKALKAGAVSARCDRGFLIVEYDPSLALNPLPGGSMHYHEFSLFYADIKDNIANRIQHFLAK